MRTTRILTLLLLVGCGDQAEDAQPIGEPRRDVGPGVTPEPDGGPGPADVGLDPWPQNVDAGLAPVDADVPVEGVCRLPPETGPCRAAIPRYYFDAQTGRCRVFTWGGCGGNGNNFKSPEACETACGGGTPVRECGGLRGLACPRGQVCDFVEDGCGAADQMGICVPRPVVCDRAYNPVCGCDGRTYSNSCEALAAGTDAAYSGPCPGPTPGNVCGGFSGRVCGRGDFCDFEGELCDWADASGICRPRPEACAEYLDPVCGCDGVNYSNTCDAQANGTDVAYSGRCR